MVDFKIDFEWLDPLGARGQELRATWARLSVIVGGYPVTRVFDERAKTVRDAVYLPLYPLAEWLAAQWWPLWNEPGPPSAPERPGFDTRHCLVSAREGYALPPLRLEPAGSLVLVSWAPERLRFQGMEFTGAGEVWAETSALMGAFSSLVDAVAGRLESAGITGTSLQEDWAAIRNADADETMFCECAGGLGLDPYALDDTERRDILDAARRLPDQIIPEFFRAARKGEIRSEADEIAALLARIQNNSGNLASLKELRRVAASWREDHRTLPWEQGYGFAQKLRSHLGLDSTPLKTLDDIRAAVVMTDTEFDGMLSYFPTRTTPFAALVGVSDNLSPGFVLRPGLVPSVRFHFCRALFEYLRPTLQRSALVTDANTEQQKRNRAFAAEMLAPASALRVRVKESVVSWERTEELADEFGVSARVIVHQLANHGIARVDRE